MNQQRFHRSTAIFINAIMIAMLVLAYLPVIPAHAGACVFTATVNGGLWNVAATWGTGGVGTACGNYPGESFAGDSVVINDGVTVTLNVAPANPIASLTINTASTASNGLTFSDSYSLNVSGAIVINATSGGPQVNSTFGVGAGTLSAANIAIAGNAGTANRYSLVSVSTGTINVTGDITFSGNAVQAQMTFTGAGTLNIGGNLGTGGTFTANTSTVNFNGSSAQSIGGYTYDNLTASNTGIKTLAGAVTVNGVLNINAAATLNTSASNYALTLGGNFVKAGTFTANGSAITISGTGTQSIAGFTTTGLITMTKTGGTATFTGNVIAGGLTINGTGGTLNLGAGLSHQINDGVTITSGSLNGGSSTLGVTGNWSRTGTFTPATSTVNFNGTGAQTIYGANTWYILSITGSTARTVSFQSGVLQTVTNSLTFTGAAGQLLTLAPGTPATAWSLNAPATQSVSYVSPSYSDASSGTTVSAANGTNTDGGNNTNWNFGGTTPPTVTTEPVDGIGATTATGHGTITSLGVPNPTQHGVVWGTALNPTIADSKTTDGAVSVTGVFTSSITGLTPSTLYHVRAYATNSAGTSYGGDVSFTTNAATGTTYYIDKTNGSCSDAGPGTSVTPFCTIQRGADIAVAGDTVHVVAGSYAETVKPVNSGNASNPITYSAAPGVTVTGEPANSSTGGGFRITSLSYIVVDGFTITGTADYGIVAQLSNHLTIRNNHVSSSGIILTTPKVGINFNTTTDSLISGNTTDHNTSHGIRLYNNSNSNTISDNISFGNATVTSPDANGINVVDSSNNTIIHNVTYANEDTGIGFYIGTAALGSSNNLVIGNLTYGNGDHGIDNNSSPSQTIVGNTVQGNYTSGINLEASSSGATIVNNIVSNNGLAPAVGKNYNTYVDATSVAGTTLNFSIYFLSAPYTQQVNWNGTGYTTATLPNLQTLGQEVNGLVGDPLFIAPVLPATRPPAITSGNYHLNMGSPAIDSANSNASNEPTLDLDGNPRADDPAVPNTGTGTRTFDDRGAYEFQPGTDQAPIITQTNPVSVSMSEDGLPTPFSLTLNATDADGDTLTWSISTPALHGTATASGTGTAKIIGYTPTANYNGSDSFIVRVSDGKGGFDEVTVNVTITPTPDTYYVDNTNTPNTCSDIGAGTISQPFCTISKGASVALSGDNVHVLHGTYAETVILAQSGTDGYPITFQADPGVTVTGSSSGTPGTPAGNGSAFSAISQSYLVIDGFNITNTMFKGINVVTSNHITISNNHVTYVGTVNSTNTQQGIYLDATTYSTVTHNITDHNSCIGIRLANGSDYNTVSNNISFANASVIVTDAAGIEMTGASHNTVIHNITYGNEDSGINLYVNSVGVGSTDNLVIGNLTYGNGDHGIDNNTSPNNVIVGNTVQGNFTSGINLEASSTGATVVNNIVSDNGTNPSGGRKPYNIYFDETSWTGATVNFNLYHLGGAYTARQIYWNNVGYSTLALFKTAVPSQEVNGLQADPLFLAPAPVAVAPLVVVTGDYHLTAGSPAIDSANSNAPSESVDDIEGHARMDDPTVTNTGAGVRLYDDRGAYEFQAPVKTTNVGDGTSPASKIVKGSDANKAVSAFTLATNTGTDTVTTLIITGSGTGLANVAANGVRLWRDNGSIPNEWDATDTALGNVSFSSGIATFTGLTIPVTTTATQYLITYTLIASPTNAQTMLAAVTGATGSNAVTNNDSVDATLTVDTVTPTISIGEPSVFSTSAGPVTYTITYADLHFNSSTLASANITLNATGGATGLVDVTGSGLTRTVTISNITGDGTLGISIAAGTASDLAGNLAPAAGPSTTFTVNNTNLLTVLKAGGGSGTVTSAPAGINCGATCSAAFTFPDDVVTLTAVASAGSTFTGWSGSCTVDPCTVTVDSAKSVTATFSRTSFSLSLSTGWNLGSFSLHPANTAIATLLSGISGKYDLVYAWDASGGHAGSGNWLKYDPSLGYGNTLSNLDETMGFWIHMTSPATLNVTGTEPSTTDTSLLTTAGTWNLVGYAAAMNLTLPDAFSTHGVGTAFSLVYAYHTSDAGDPWKMFDRTGVVYANDLTELSPGWGYWIKVSANNTWSISYLAP